VEFHIPWVVYNCTDDPKKMTFGWVDPAAAAEDGQLKCHHVAL